MEHIWDYHFEQRSNVVDAYIRYLRDKVDRPFGPTQSRRYAAWATGYAFPRAAL